MLTVTDRDGLRNSVTNSIKIVQTYPSASFTITPPSPSEGTWVSFNDSSHSSNVSHSAIQGWQWEFDGAPSNTTSNARHQFGAGEHTVRLTVRDADGISNSTPLHFFNVTESRPTAGFQSSPAKVGSSVYLNSTSVFAWTPIVRYCWNFGDGNSVNGTGSNVVHTFTMKGWYRIVLNVTDAQGFTDEIAHWLFVAATPPTATIALNGPSAEGNVSRFSVCTSSFNPIISWNWSYDNNQTWHLFQSEMAGASFTFANSGEHWVSLNVTETDGSWYVAGMMVEVQETNPRIQGFGASDGSVCELDQNVSFWVSAVSYKPITKYEWNFDFGSGGVWVASTPFLTNHTSCAFTRPGIHYVTVRVWDDDGFTQYGSYLEVQVNDPAPKAHFSFQNSTQNSGVVLFDATLSTDNPSDTASLTYAWNFGDQGGWTNFSASNRAVSHGFGSDGRYNITLIVKDQWGSESPLAQSIILVDRTPPLVVMESTGSNASASQAIVVSVKVTDQFGVKNVTLVYRVNSGNETSITMTPMNEPDTFYAQIPAQGTGTNVSYRITAIDTNSNPYSTQTYVLNIKAAPSPGISRSIWGC